MPGAARPVVRASSGVKLAVRNLTMCYENGYTALSNLNLSVSAGEMVVVLGSNGSGKSTFMKCVVGLNRPTGGSVKSAGRDLAALSREALRRAGLPPPLFSPPCQPAQRRRCPSEPFLGGVGAPPPPARPPPPPPPPH